MWGQPYFPENSGKREVVSGTSGVKEQHDKFMRAQGHIKL
jgi:hypothetical protein